MKVNVKVNKMTRDAACRETLPVRRLALPVSGRLVIVEEFVRRRPRS